MALDLASLAKWKPVPPQWLIERWLPAGAVTLFAGHGGSGKSFIALVAAVCLAAGIAFYGIPIPRRFRVFFYSCEDAHDVLHWRLATICAALGVDMSALDGWLLIYDAVGCDNVMFTSNLDVHERTTARYRWLQQSVVESGAEVVILDNASDVYDGNEIVRAQVRQFIGTLAALVRERAGAALLLAHVDKQTAKASATSEGYSGSTAWNNTVRSRWYLRDGEEQDSRILARQKANYTGTGDDALIALRWDDGKHCFLPDVPLTDGGIVGAIKRKGYLKEIVSLVSRLTAAGQNVSAAKTAPNHPFRLAQDRRERLATPRREWWAVLDEAIHSRYLGFEQYRGTDRNTRQRLVVTDAGREFIR